MELKRRGKGGEDRTPGKPENQEKQEVKNNALTGMPDPAPFSVRQLRLSQDRIQRSERAYQSCQVYRICLHLPSFEVPK